MNKQGREKNGKYQKGREMPKEEREKIAQAQLGNSNRLKLKTEDVQKAAYAAYCQWIASGRGKKGFVFDYVDEETGKEGYVGWQTIEKCIEDQRFELNPEYKERAENISYQVWENTGIEMMQGKVDKCQPAIYQMMMRNKFGWDKESKITHSHQADAAKFMKVCDDMKLPEEKE